jgi:hypothetical protein
VSHYLHEKQNKCVVSSRVSNLGSAGHKADVLTVPARFFVIRRDERTCFVLKRQRHNNLNPCSMQKLEYGYTVLCENWRHSSN